MYFTLSLSGLNAIGYSEFMKLAKESKFAKITIKGGERMIGEFKPGELENIEPEYPQIDSRNNRLETSIPAARNHQRQRHPQAYRNPRSLQR